jgi:hypothetical protein
MGQSARGLAQSKTWRTLERFKQSGQGAGGCLDSPDASKRKLHIKVFETALHGLIWNSWLPYNKKEVACGVLAPMPLVLTLERPKAAVALRVFLDGFVKLGFAEIRPKGGGDHKFGIGNLP